VISHNPAVVVRTLGGFELRVRETHVELGDGRPPSIFYYLLVKNQHRVSREALIEALWSDSETQAPGNSLNVAVYGLRRLLSSTAERGIDQWVNVVAHASGYQLMTPGGIWLDFEEFEQCCRRGLQHDSATEYSAAAAEYARAVELYDGEFLPNVPDEWVAYYREHLKDLFLQAAGYLAQRTFEEGDFAECIQLCKRLLEHDRFQEETYRLLMRCHARLGQRERVIRWYRLCVQTLRSRLDADPDPVTTETLRLALVPQVAQIGPD
jgi:DNA-binding SARP family transcriptional activator